MKLGMTSLTFRNESVENVIKIAKRADLCGIEWGVSDLHMPLGNVEQAEKIKRLSQQYDIEIFSLGSYCRMLKRKECDDALNTAIMLGAPIIRIWAGEQSPQNCDIEYKKLIAENTIYMAKKAESYGVNLGFEYHQGTLTENADDAIELIERINQNNVGLYWQPFGSLTAKDNFDAMTKVLPYLCGNLHIHNYNGFNGYGSLAEIKEDLRTYYNDLKNKKYNLLIEFVKDSSIENLLSDAKLLKQMII